MLLRQPRIRSIRARVTVGFALAVSALMAITGGAMTHFSRRQAESAANRLLSATVRKLMYESAGGQRISRAELAEEERDLRVDGLVLILVDSGGRLVERSAGRIPAWPPRDDNLWRTASLRIGTDTLIVALPWSPIESGLQRQSVLLSVMSLLAVGISAAGAWFLVGRTLSPISRLSDQAKAASVDTLKIRLDPPSDDAEVESLVATLNELLGRLEETAESKGRFYAAASHELRTPLQALSGHLELALCRERTANEYREAIEEASRQTRRLISLIQGLLFLTRIDSETARSTYQPVDLAEICERSLAVMREQITARQLDLKCDLHISRELMAPAGQVDVLVRNIVENAVKHSSERGSIRLELRESDSGTRLMLSNTCERLNPDDVHRLFEPFYRPDKSRSQETGGTGLGLAICKSIADSNGWPIQLSTEEQGLLVQVHFTGRSEPARAGLVESAG